MGKIEIKSSLVNDEDFSDVKESLIQASNIDGKDKFRVKLLEYINDKSYNDDDMFFFDMLEFVRFLDPRQIDDIAYTTPDHLIYMNAPGGGYNNIGENVKQWDFTYDHECLHQLWDTFGVAEKIKEKVGKYNHYLLNIASDCVINDYLSAIRKKEIPNGLITPEYLHDTYGVDYNRKEDTQFSLYMKLKKIMDEQQELFKKMMQDPRIKKALEDMENSQDGQEGQDGQDGQEGQEGQNGQGKGKDSKEGGDLPDDAMIDPAGGNKQSGQEGKEGKNVKGGGSAGQDAQDAADNAKGNAKAAKDAADKAKNDGNSDAGEKSDAAKKAEEAAKKAQEEADKAKEAEKNGDAKGAKEHADKAKEYADEARKQAEKAGAETSNKNAQGKPGKKENESSNNQDISGDPNFGWSHDTIEKTPVDFADDAASKASQAAENAKNAVSNAKRRGGSNIAEKEKAAEKAAKAAQKAKEHADKAKEADRKGDKDTAVKEAKEAAKAAQEAIEGESAVLKPSKEDLEKIRHKAKEKIEEYKNKISGAFGDFIKKCKNSVTCNPNGLAVTTPNGPMSWNSKMKTCINAFIKKRIFQKKREIEFTYKRMNRRQGVINYGDPLKKGKRVKKNGMTINIAFYIDRSGSMSGEPIVNVFKAAYTMTESIKRMFKAEKVVDEIAFKIFTFDDVIEEIPFGKTVQARGGNVPFHDIMNYINNHTNDFLINIIITDAQFEFNEDKMKKFIKDQEGLILFITNIDNADIKNIAKQTDFSTKINYILADRDFTVKN